MDSRARVDAVCTIGRLLTPNSHKVTTVRVRQSYNRDFKFTVMKMLVSHKMGKFILWETQDFITVNLKSRF